MDSCRLWLSSTSPNLYVKLVHEKHIRVASLPCQMICSLIHAELLTHRRCRAANYPFLISSPYSFTDYSTTKMNPTLLKTWSSSSSTSDMSNVSAFSSIILRKSIVPLSPFASSINRSARPRSCPCLCSCSSPLHFHSVPVTRIRSLAQEPPEPELVPGRTPPEFPSPQTAPDYQPGTVPPEIPRAPPPPMFDPVPQEVPSDPPPGSPGYDPGPDIPRPPLPSPPVPDIPLPKPEVPPPQGPDLVPPRPPSIDPPSSTPPEVVPPPSLPPEITPPNGPIGGFVF